MSEELKPCPFCGSYDRELKAQDMIPQNACVHAPEILPIFWVQCDACQSTGPVTFTGGEAIKKWNDRSS